MIVKLVLYKCHIDPITVIDTSRSFICLITKSWMSIRVINEKFHWEEGRRLVVQKKVG